MGQDARRIVDRVRELGIALGPGVEDYEDRTGPECNERWIWLNGVGDGEHETLLVYGPGREALDAIADAQRWSGRSGFLWAFCKTARKPYDLAVAAILLRLHELAPEAFVIASDGSWHDAWLHGAGERGPSPRTLCHELFQTPIELGDPLQYDTTAGPPSALAIETTAVEIAGELPVAT
jgi:hypothetical protein